MEVLMNLNLKLKILEKYQSQADFAISVGAHESLVSRIIRGRRRLDPEKQITWAEALNSTPRELFGQEQIAWKIKKPRGFTR